ncbi:hypothetical protein ACFL2C_01605 [Patescibacteria group bacterium]
MASKRRKSKLLRKLKIQWKRIKDLKKPNRDKNLIKKGRKEKVKRRKNFFASFLLIILLWLLLLLFVYFVDPSTLLAKLAFFSFVFAMSTFTASFVFTNMRRGVLTAVFVTVFLVLRVFGVGNIINLLLLLGLIVSADYYLKN